MAGDVSARGRVTVGLSGGVDSSVSALLLQQAGWQTDGIFVHSWRDEEDKACGQAALDAQDAYSIAASLGIPVRQLDLCEDYRRFVFEPFLDEYRRGRTPNPDVLCNRYVKCEGLLRAALDDGADYLATGHYARHRRDEDGRMQLLRATDENKDQTYFLHRLTQEQLSHVLFPVGEQLKSDVRRLAEEKGLITHDKRDSTGICFIGERDFRSFLGNYLPQQSGLLMTPEGRVVGEHQGAWLYTIGQRRGLAIGGVSGTDESPWFVCNKDIEKNIVYVVQGREHPLLYAQDLRIGQLHWIAGTPPPVPWTGHSRLRHRQPLQACRITGMSDDECVVRADERQWAPAVGQAMVFYDGMVCLGGGIIEAYSS